MARDNKATERKTGVAGWNESEGTGRRAAGRHNASAADRRRRLVAVAFVLVCCVASLVCMWPPNEQIRRGLWFKGGTAQTMTATDEVTAEELSNASSTISSRLGAAGVSEYAVETSGSDTVLIKLPWYVDGSRIAQMVGGAGELEFVRVDEIGDADALTLLNAGAEDVTLKKGTYTAFLTNDDVTSCETTLVSDGVYAITINFTDEAAQTFADVTEELAEDYGSIAIVVDGLVLSSPMVSEKIDGGQVSISGGFTQEEAGALKAVIDSQALPTNLALAGSEEIGALAGSMVVALPIVAACVGVAVTVLAFMRMRRLGLLVGATEAVLAVLMLGLMALISRIEAYMLTIPALVGGFVACAAGVVASWLVLDRFRALVGEGRSVRGSSLNATAEALGRFGLPVACVAVVSLVFLFLPMPVLREFGLSCALGIIASAVAVLLFQTPLLRVLATGSMQRDAAGWGLQVTGSSEDRDAARSS